MGGFLRMIVYGRIAGDAEFVEALRKEMAKPPRSPSIQVLLALAAFTMGIAGAVVLANFLTDVEASLRNAATAGAMAGFGIGAVVALGYGAIVACRREAASMRTAQLLLKYHDELAWRALPGDDEAAGRKDNAGPRAGSCQT